MERRNFGGGGSSLAGKFGTKATTREIRKADTRLRKNVGCSFETSGEQETQAVE